MSACMRSRSQLSRPGTRCRTLCRVGITFGLLTLFSTLPAVPCQAQFAHLFESDTDRDGTSDASEELNGTDPNDPGSVLRELNGSGYALWNGFFNQVNILEVFNSATADVAANLSIYNINGKQANSLAVPTLGLGQQFDTVLNVLKPGFNTDSYGLLKVDYSETANGRLTFYRNNNSGYDFAYSLPLLPPSYGESSVAFNTFQPSLNSRETNNLVANWHTLVNLSQTTKRFTREIYSQTGSLVLREQVSVPAVGRVDLDGGHSLLGPSEVGLIRTIPENDNVPYLSQITRFGANAPAGVPTTNFDFAFPLVAKTASGRPQQVLISSAFGAQNWLEVVNTRATTVEATVEFYRAGGAVSFTQTYLLPPHGQVHIPASAYLAADETGLATITPKQKNSLVVQSMFYVRDAFGSIVSMYGSQADEAYDDTFTGSYNLFLGMENYLSAANTENKPVAIELVVNSVKGEYREELRLDPHETVVIPLHNTTRYNTVRDSYGVVQIIAPRSGFIRAELIRVKPDEFIFPTEMKSNGRAKINLCPGEPPAPTNYLLSPMVVDYELGFPKKELCGRWALTESKSGYDFQNSRTYSFQFFSDGTYEIRHLWGFTSTLVCPASYGSGKDDTTEKGVFYFNGEELLLIPLDVTRDEGCLNDSTISKLTEAARSYVLFDVSYADSYVCLVSDNCTPTSSGVVLYSNIDNRPSYQSFADIAFGKTFELRLQRS